MISQVSTYPTSRSGVHVADRAHPLPRWGLSLPTSLHLPLAPVGAEDGSRGQARRAQPPVSPQEEMRPGRAAGAIAWPQSRGAVPAPFQGAPMPRRLPGARHATRVPAPGYHPWPRWGQQQQPEMWVMTSPRGEKVDVSASERGIRGGALRAPLAHPPTTVYLPTRIPPFTPRSLSLTSALSPAGLSLPTSLADAVGPGRGRGW